MLELDLCHIKTISNPYMGHIWVKDYPRCKNWTLDFEPAFSQRFCFLLSPRSIFPTAQRFPIRKHVTSGFRALPVTSLPVWSCDFRSLPVPVASKRGCIQTRPLHQNEAKCAIRADITTFVGRGKWGICFLS